MSPEDWNYLKDCLAQMGLAAPEQPPQEDEELHHVLASANGVAEPEAHEWLAGHFHMLPLAALRPTCSSRGEAVFRNLAVAGSAEDEPWLPIGSLGPLLILAHYNPTSGSFWQIPTEFIIPVILTRAAYKVLKHDLDERLSFKALERTNPVVLSSALPRKQGLNAVLEWLLKEYPFSDSSSVEAIREERSRLMASSEGKDEVLWKMSRSLGVALHYLNTGEACFNPEHAPSQNLIPDSLLEKHGVYPLFTGFHVVYLLSENKHNFAFEDEWLSTGHESYEFRSVRAEREAILKVIERERSRKAGASGTAISTEGLVYSDDENIIEIDPQTVARINPSSINTTPEQVIHWVLHRAITGRASDLHVEKFFNLGRFRARIDGELRVIHTCQEEQLPRLIALIKNYSNMGQRRQTAEDGRFSLLLGRKRVDCRVSAIPCRRDLQKLTIRFLDKEGGLRKLSELNLSDWQLGVFKEAMGRDQGLILITGPTGSGKTTTLYALLNSINNESINIHTVEDPIEYEIEGLNQTQTDPINGITFAEGLRRLMRADPDVILIGECRDEETATAAVNAALTGHLVLTTLHANDSLRAVSRLIAMGVPSYLLADSLALSQAQRLVRKLCTYCKRPVALSPDIREIFRANRITIPPDVEFIQGANGCPECGGSGYSGRLALMELCPFDSELADLVSVNAPQAKMREVALRRGFLTLYQQGLLQVLAGNTTMEEISCLSYTALTSEPADDTIVPIGTAVQPRQATATASS